MHEKNQQSLILALRNPSVSPHATDRWQLIETHISCVVFCGLSMVSCWLICFQAEYHGNIYDLINGRDRGFAKLTKRNWQNLSMNRFKRYRIQPQVLINEYSQFPRHMRLYRTPSNSVGR